MSQQELMEEMRRDMLDEDRRDFLFEVDMRSDDDLFEESLRDYLLTHTVREIIEYIEHYDRDADYWFDILLEK